MIRKLLILLPFIVGLSFANVASAESVLDKLVKKVTNFVVKEFKEQFGDQANELICRKANVLAGKFSIRSAKGKGCQNRFIAAIAELSCQNRDVNGKMIDINDSKRKKEPIMNGDYIMSQCHINALKALGDENPADVLTSELKAKGKKVGEEFCKSASDNSKVIKGICDKMQAVDKK